MKITRQRLEELILHSQALLRALDAQIPLPIEEERAILAATEQLSRIRNMSLAIAVDELGLRRVDIVRISGKDWDVTSNMVGQGRIYAATRGSGVVVTPPENVDQISVDQLVLSTRTHNVLRHRQIRTVGQIRAHSAKELCTLSNMGHSSVENIRLALQQLGVNLRED